MSQCLFFPVAFALLYNLCFFLHILFKRWVSQGKSYLMVVKFDGIGPILLYHGE